MSDIRLKENKEQPKRHFRLKMIGLVLALKFFSGIFMYILTNIK